MLAERYRAVRSFTAALAAPLSEEDAVVQSMPDASPAKWHLAHTTWFFETFVLAHDAGHRPFDPRYAVLFNSYYDAVGERHPRPERGLLTRPSLAEVKRYRDHVDEAMMSLLTRRDDLAAELAFTVTLGLHHEQQHQELLLTDIEHAFSRNPMRPAYRDASRAPAVGDVAPPRLIWHSFSEGLHAIGHDRAKPGFAFDNESPRHRVFIESFELASRLVTNAEYAEFVLDGGYDRSEFWLSDGWATAKSRGWRAPLHWERPADGALDSFKTFTLYGLRPIDPHTPVCHVSYYEADAYARWAGARLANEAEWETVAERVEPSGNFVEQNRLAPAPIDANARGDRPEQLFGDVWEWTASPYVAYPGFAPFGGELGEYNGKFMCNQMVLRGGSCLTSRSHIRSSYRNFFPPDARWQYTGIRLARIR